MNEWTVGKTPWKADQRFRLRRHMLRRIPRALGLSANPPKATRVITKATVMTAAGIKKGDERHLGCRLPEGIETEALYTLENAEALDKLVARMKTMWKRVTGNT